MRCGSFMSTWMGGSDWYVGCSTGCVVVGGRVGTCCVCAVVSAVATVVVVVAVVFGITDVGDAVVVGVVIVVTAVVDMPGRRRSCTERRRPGEVPGKDAPKPEFVIEMSSGDVQTSSLSLPVLL